MKLYMFIVLATLGGCSSVSGKQQTVAQCQMDALGSKGATFRKNYADGKFVPSPKDGSYREFMLTCMQAKGFEFAPPFNAHGDNKACWIEDKVGMLPDAFVDEPSCYNGKWW